MMFFRSLGGSIGLAVGGTLLNATIRADLPRRTGVDADGAVALIRAPQQIEALPAETRQAVIDTLSSGVSLLMWVGAACMTVAVAFALWLPELPLRHRAGISDALEAAAG
jgi:hypothetical protein